MKQEPAESALVKTNQTGSSESSPFSKGAEDVNFGSLPIRFALFTPPSCFNMPCMASILEVRDLRVTYRSRGGPAFRALDGVSFSLESGEVLGVLGESGSGKSTLATSLLGLFCANALTVSGTVRSEEHTSELQSHSDLVCRLLLEKKKMK